MKAVFKEYKGNFDKWDVSLGDLKVFEGGEKEDGSFVKKVSCSWEFVLLWLVEAGDYSLTLFDFSFLTPGRCGRKTKSKFFPFRMESAVLSLIL